MADTPVPALLVPPATGGGGAAESDPVLPDPAAVITQTGQDAPALVALSQTTEPEPPETVANLIAPLPQPDALPGPGAADQPGQVQAALPVPGTDAAAQPAAGKIVATLAEPVLPQSLAAPQTETVAKTAAKPEAAPGPQGAAVPALTAAGEDEAPMAVANPAPAAVSRADIILADPAAAKAAEASPGLTDPGIVPLADQGVLVDAAPPAKPKILEHGTAKPVLPGAATGPATGFAGTTPGVTLNRLPRIGGETPTNPAAEPALDPSGLPPLERNSADFENPQGRPLFSVILLDTGEMDPAALLNIGFPVTFALDPMRADVAQAAMAWRAAGQEVLILATALPPGATAADVEVTFQSHFASLPSALGVIDLPQKGFQDDRALSQNIVETLKGAGYGLVTFDRGLDPAAQVAKREGVRQAMVFRTLDAEGENVPTVRRYLDRAAFKAAQLGSVVVFGSTRPDTVQGLIEWAAEGRAATVVMAPISAVMSLE